MPNWCSNSITISGSTDTIKQLWDDAHVGDDFGLLNAMVPMPKELEGTTAPSEEANWYEWCIENWGTKWDITDEGLEYIDNGDGTSVIAGWFDSAWGPPIEAYNTFLDDMDGCSLSATYEEGGMDFAGIYEDGDDQYMEGLEEWCEKVVRGTCALEDTPELFQKLEDEFELIENRREWIEEEMEEEKEKETSN
tara:strand:+ start:419 stop:997 length:579 start_codon:yes stop_codon:yes gene_type:complete